MTNRLKPELLMTTSNFPKVVLARKQKEYTKQAACIQLKVNEDQGQCHCERVQQQYTDVV